MKKLLTALAFLPSAYAQIAEADVMQTYSITEVYNEPDYIGGASDGSNMYSIFTGTFTYDVTTGTISALQGTLSEVMTGSSQSTETLLSLGYQLAPTAVNPGNDNWYTASSGTQESDGNGGLLASTYLNNSTTLFKTITGNNVAYSGTTVSGYAYNAGISGNNFGGSVRTGAGGNANVTIDVSYNSSLGTLVAASNLNQLSYNDCTAGGAGLMGGLCMTGNGSATGGTMFGYATSEVVSEVTGASVPEPATLPLLATGFAAFGAAYRRSKSTV